MPFPQQPGLCPGAGSNGSGSRGTRVPLLASAARLKRGGAGRGKKNKPGKGGCRVIRGGRWARRCRLESPILARRRGALLAISQRRWRRFPLGITRVLGGGLSSSPPTTAGEGGGTNKVKKKAASR